MYKEEQLSKEITTPLMLSKQIFFLKNKEIQIATIQKYRIKKIYSPTSVDGATCDNIALDIGPIMPLIKPKHNPIYSCHQKIAVALTVLSRTQLAKEIIVIDTIENFKSYGQIYVELKLI